MPPRIVRNEEAAANYGRWVAGLRRDAARTARERHRARRHAGRAASGVTEQKANAVRHAWAVRKAAAGAPSLGPQRSHRGQIEEVAAPPQDHVSAWFVAGLRRPRAGLALRSTLFLGGFILALYALGMVGTG